MDVTSIRPKTQPAEFISASLTDHMLTSTIFIDHNSTVRTWLSFEKLPCICNSLSVWCAHPSNRVWYLFPKSSKLIVFPGVPAWFTLQVVFASFWWNKPKVLTPCGWTSPHIFRVRCVDLQQFVRNFVYLSLNIVFHEHHCGLHLFFICFELLTF